VTLASSRGVTWRPDLAGAYHGGWTRIRMQRLRSFADVGPSFNIPPSQDVLAGESPR